MGGSHPAGVRSDCSFNKQTDDTKDPGGCEKQMEKGKLWPRPGTLGTDQDAQLFPSRAQSHACPMWIEVPGLPRSPVLWGTFTGSNLPGSLPDANRPSLEARGNSPKASGRPFLSAPRVDMAVGGGDPLLSSESVHARQDASQRACSRLQGSKRRCCLDKDKQRHGCSHSPPASILAPFICWGLEAQLNPEPDFDPL